MAHELLHPFCFLAVKNSNTGKYMVSVVEKGINPRPFKPVVGLGDVPMRVAIKESAELNKDLGLTTDKVIEIISTINELW